MTNESRDFLRSMGLPPGDLNDLPDSAVRFPDGAQYRVEIPSTEGPRCLEAVLEEADRLDVRIHRVSQGSGVFLLTDAELDEMARMAAEARVEVSLFARPNAGWGVSAMARSAAGGTLAPAAHGQEQIVAAPRRHPSRRRPRVPQRPDRRHRPSHRVRRGARRTGSSRRHAGEDLGDAPGRERGDRTPDRRPPADTINLPTDLSLAQIAAIRAAMDVPLDVYVEAPDNSAASSAITRSRS